MKKPMKKRILIENYYKFLETHPKYFKSHLSNMNRYGFTEIDDEFLYKIDSKPKEYVRNIIKIRNIIEGHIVFRYTTHTYQTRTIEIFYNEKILDKYGEGK